MQPKQQRAKEGEDAVSVDAVPVDAVPDDAENQSSSDGPHVSRPRVLLLSEFFPVDPERFVFGAFQRLRCHVDALGAVGRLDAVFLWPESNHATEPDVSEHGERVRSAWHIEGDVRFVSAEVTRRRSMLRHPLRTLYWIWRGAVSFFDSTLTLRTSGPRLRARLRAHVAELQPDLIFAHGPGATSALTRAGIDDVPVILDLYDLEHVRIARLAEESGGLRQRFRYWRWSKIAQRATRLAAERAHFTLVCSRHDGQELTRFAGKARPEIVPNTTADVSPLPLPERPTAMFVGIADYPPNAEAIRALVEDIWPRVCTLVPDAEVTIVGQGARALFDQADFDQISAAGCHILDFVPELDTVYREARIALCPIFRGSGTRIKIIEAAMRGRAVVSTTVGAEGLVFEPGREILIADDAQGFAEACASLLTASAHAGEIGGAARERALSQYSRAQVVDTLCNVVRRALRTPEARPRAFLFIGGTSEPGGVHVHTVDVALALSAAGHSVTIVCPSVDYFSSMLQGSPVVVEVIPERKFNESTLGYWRRHLSRHGDATAVLCRGELGSGSLMDLVAIRRSTRQLVTIDHRNYDPPWSKSLPPRVHGWVMRWAVSRCIGVSEEIKEAAVQELRIPEERVVTCLNWARPEFGLAGVDERRAAKAHLGLPEDALVLGYHGRLAPEKRLDVLIRAVAALPPALREGHTVAVVGDGWKRPMLEELVEECGVGRNVRFLGWQPATALAVAAFDLYVLPSLAEGFPLGLMEAMGRGAVCLAHPMSSTLRLIRHGENGFLADVDDPETLAPALAELLQRSAEERAAVGAAAAQTIRDEFSRERRLPDVLRALGVDPAGVQMAQVVRGPEFGASQG